jgi:hypothetical protein
MEGITAKLGHLFHSGWPADQKVVIQKDRDHDRDGDKTVIIKKD